MSTSTRERSGGAALPPTPPPSPPAPPGGARPVGLGPLGWARWVWRQLTSMRTALFLLLLLAVGAVPGSVFPQTGIDPVRVTQYKVDHPHVSWWLERLGGFDVYGSPWFAAIYLLLFVSLVGCVLPRARVHLRNLREAPPRTPADLSRLPEHRSATTTADAEAALAAAAAVLRRRRYRLGEHPGSLAAQRGELRESGNLVFHLALIGVLLSFATSSLFGYRGQDLVPVGKAFVDSMSSIDTMDAGAFVDTDDLPPYRFLLKAVHVAFDSSSTGNQYGAPRSFAAHVDVTDTPGAAARARVIEVNHPLRVDGATVYLAGNGYAPVITVRDSTGRVAFHGEVPFLVRDANYTSNGVVKVPDAAGTQIGLRALFLPTAYVDKKLGPVSTFPDLRKPRLVFAAYTGDLGLDGVAQNVYELDTRHMKQVLAADGSPFSASLAPHQSVALPGGAGTVTFDSVQRYAGFTFRHDPGRVPALVSALLAIAGLTVSLFVPRRRLWVRATSVAGGRTRVEVGALARSEDHGLGAEADAVLAAVLAALPASEDDLTSGPTAGPTTGPAADPTDHAPDHEPADRRAGSTR